MPPPAIQQARSGNKLAFAAARPYAIEMLDKSTGSPGRETGLKQLLADMRSDLTRFLLSRNCNPPDVEDVLQDVFIKLTSIQTGPVSNPRAYLYQMANNLLLDRRRGRRRQEGRDGYWARSQLGQDLETDPTPSPEQSAIDRDELRRVERALAELPPRSAEILRMYRVEGQPQKVIAECMGISLSSVEKHLQRAYRALLQIREALDAEPQGHETEADDVSTS